jgi:hypothetical protein
MAEGYSTKKGQKKIAISMPEEVFDKIARRAKADGVSFNTKALELLRCGLFDYEESEEYEPKAA